MAFKVHWQHLKRIYFKGLFTLAKSSQAFWIQRKIGYKGKLSNGNITAAFLVWRQMLQRQMLQRQNFGGFLHPIAIKPWFFVMKLLLHFNWNCIFQLKCNNKFVTKNQGFIFAFCLKMGPKISNILSMVDELNISVGSLKSFLSWHGTF